MKESYSLVELFSGIGSQKKALDNIGINCEVQATCEWDIHAFIAYDAIINRDTTVSPEIDCKSKDEILDDLSCYTLSNNGKAPMSKVTLATYPADILKRILTSVKRNNNLVNINEVDGSRMPDDTDILTYSFPCQDLSNVGAFHGYNKGIDKDAGNRSSLLWQVGRILTEMKACGKKLPRYLIMENVPTLLSTRHFGNFKEWISELSGLGYISKYIPVNAKNYGIPQNRPRLLMMSVFVGDDKSAREAISTYFDTLGDSDDIIVKEYRDSTHFRQLTVRDLIRCDNDRTSRLWREAVECVPNDTPSRRKIWDENPVIVGADGKVTDKDCIRTVTTKLDRHPNSGNIYIDTGIKGRSKFRYLTPRECLLFMGFTDEDYEILVDNNPSMGSNRSTLFTRDKIIRMAGNSIPVKMLEGFFYQLYKTEPLLGY